MATLLPEKVYQHLRQRLLAGEFVPGSKLEYKGLSAEMGVSTTPVREAMGKLASEGLVDLVPHAGAVVRKPGEQETAQFYGVREAIETYAAAKAAHRISDADLEQLATLLTRMRQLISSTNGRMKNGKLSEFIDADLAFHMTIIEAVGNPRLTKLVGDSHIHSRVFAAERLEHDNTLLKEEVELHASIYRALKRRDAAKASELTARHIRRSLERQIGGGDSSNSATCQESAVSASH